MLAVDEMIVDSFAGGGGASEGIWMATGRHPDIAINHSPEALALHARNHPFTQHYQEDVWKVDPRVACAGAASDCSILDTMDRNPPDDWSIVTLDFIRRAVTNWIGHGRPTAEGRHWALLTDKGNGFQRPQRGVALLLGMVRPLLVKDCAV